MPRVFDEPACRRGDSRLAADALGEWRHEGRAPGDAGAGDVEPQAYVEQVETAGGEAPGQRDRLLEGLLAAVGLADAEAQGERHDRKRVVWGKGVSVRVDFGGGRKL